MKMSNLNRHVFFQVLLFCDTGAFAPDELCFVTPTRDLGMSAFNAKFDSSTNKSSKEFALGVTASIAFCVLKFSR